MAFPTIPSAYDPKKIGVGLNVLAQGSVPSVPTSSTPLQTARPSYESQAQPRTGGSVPMGLMNTPQAVSSPTMQNNLQNTAQQARDMGQSPPIAIPQAAPTVDYAALAASRTALALAQKKSIADAQKGSLDRSFARDNQITNDNRTLENGQINRTLSPFSGKTSYDKGIIGRERTLVDENKSNNLSAQKANIDQLLADYQNATADEQVRIADELQRADRQYQLDLANVTGTYNGQKTAAQSNADRSYNQSQQQIDYQQNPNNPSNYGQALTNQLNELKLGNYPNEVKQQAQLFEQELKSGKMSLETAEYNLKELKDPQSATNRVKALDLQMKELEAKNLPETERLKLQQLKKTIAEIGAVHYKPKTADEAEYDKQQVIKIKAEIDKIKNGASTPAKVDAKESANTHQTVALDIADAADADEANRLIDANKDLLTDADYKDLKKKVIDKF